MVKLAFLHWRVQVIFCNFISRIYIFYSQIGNTKSADGKMTLTHFLAEMIESKYPEVNGFEHELSHLKEGHKGIEN